MSCLRLSRLWLALCAFLFAASASADANVSLRRLKVVSPSGKPVTGVKARFYTEGHELDLSRAGAIGGASDRNGVVEWAPSENAQVCVLTSPGWATEVIRPPFPETIRLNKGHDVRFQLMGPEGAVVGALAWEVLPGVRLAIRSTEQGEGTLPGLPLREVEVHATAPSLAVRRRVTAPDEAVVLNLVRRDATLVGSVLAEEGGPVAGAMLTLEREPIDDGGYSLRETSSDASGGFRVDALMPGRYRLEAFAPGTARQVVQVDVAEQRTVTLRPIRLRSGPSVSVQFLDRVTGRPVRQARVITESNDRQGFSLRDVFVPRTAVVGDNDGRVTVSGIAAGPLTLALDAPPWARTRLPTIDIAPDSGPVDLGSVAVDRGAALDVIVTDGAGREQADVPVVVDQGPALSPLEPATASTDERGLATFDRLGKGRYRLRVGGDGRAGGRAVLWERWLSVGESDERLQERVKLEFIDVSVHVAQSFLPAGGRMVTLLSEDSNADTPVGIPVRLSLGSQPERLLNAPPLRAVQATTDEDGTALLRRTQPGTHTLSVDLECSEWSKPVSVERAGRVIEAAVPGGAVAFAVGDQAGRPIPLARAVWKSTTGESVAAGAGKCAADVVLRGVAAAAGELEVSAPGYLATRLTLGGPAEVPASVDLEPSEAPVVVVARVVDGSGQPLADASVEATQRTPSGARYQTASGPDGTCEIRGLEPGPALLSVSRRGYAPLVGRAAVLVPGVNEGGALVLSRGFRILVRRKAGESGPARVGLRLYDESSQRVDSYLDDGSLLAVGREESVSLGPVSPGRYVLEVRGVSAVLQRISVSVVESDVEVENP